MEATSWSQAAILFLIAIIWNFGSLTDLVIFSLFTSMRNISGIFFIFNRYINPTIVTNILYLATLSFITLQIYRYVSGLNAPTGSFNGYPVKPMLFPCQTSHTRIFPKKHSFSYSYLLVGIPIGWRGSSGGMILSDDELVCTPWYQRLFSSKPGSAWYKVNGDDYLARGHVDGGLRGKLDAYLLSQGEDPKDYPHAYLLTAARFLGYFNNPLSIWNLYSPSKTLSALILEVNNTFDERHPYFLKLSPPSTSILPDVEKKERSTHTWPKQFYVSPVNSRLGSYSLTFCDPFAPSLTGAGLVDNTITLISSEKHAKLVARVFSTRAPIDPSTMSVWAKTMFLAKWWWVSLATFPRTVKEAFILIFKKGLRWVSRPEPMKETMARHADVTENLIEEIFRNWLRHVVENAREAVVITYVSTRDGVEEKEVMLSPSAQLVSSDDERKELEIRILSPSFFSNFVPCTDSLEALLSEHQNETISLSDPELFKTLDFDISHPSAPSPMKLDFFERLRWRALRDLRPQSTNPKMGNRGNGLSSFEHFILTHCDARERRNYASRILRLFLSSRLAFGSLDILDVETFVLKFVAMWFIVWSLW